ncbi:S-adenosyl-L-methionine-dependent methyltransferase [Linderina pennispora]|uniref:S-adenosyl-L-methionine-dependent methyltransferase n=1 Tax=Linderina pennispora TaxID=61395 RepID=A0A1Y1WHB3_9FUNG|nr:S-adenosyl-L-methionine-dependent methyltransferase [Linderina pennispora]ORX72728.1 S-adenosyl-L-methionine-dependent methyltransferase [Linderina pennispora]
MDDTYTSLAQRYDAFHGSMPLNGAQRGKDQIMKMIKPRRGTLFLDMAGGTGDMSVSFLKYQASVNKDKESTAVVFDLNKEMLEVARRRLEDTGWSEQAKVVHGNAEDLSMFGDGSFDIYCCVFGLHNMPNHEKVLKEAFRVIKPGGRLVVGEINTGTRRVARALIRMLFVHVIFPIAYHRLSDSAMTDRLAKSALGFPAPE